MKTIIKIFIFSIIGLMSCENNSKIQSKWIVKRIEHKNNYFICPINSNITVKYAFIVDSINTYNIDDTIFYQPWK